MPELEHPQAAHSNALYTISVFEKPHQFRGKDV